MGRANDEVLSLITSSEFEMELSPTVEKLNSTAATRVELAIKSVLLLASTGTGSFQQVFDVDIVLQKIEWGIFGTQAQPSTLLQFEVHMAFFNDKVTMPTKFALDSLITRTFSQPSTKSTFLATLELSKEPTLADIGTVEIQALAIPSVADDETEDKARSISDLDIVLITASVLMFLGVIYVICQYHKDKARLEEQHTRTFDEWSQRSRKAKARNPNANYTPDLNQTGLTSMQSDEESNPETDSTVGGTRPSETNSEKRPTPPISPCASFPMSPGECSHLEIRSSTSRPFSHKIGSVSLNSDPVGALTNLSLQKQPSSSSGRLGTRLSSLPLMNPTRRIGRLSQSSLSAQDDFMKSMSDVSASKGSSVGDMSSVFKMSTASSNGDMSSIFKSSTTRRGSNQKSHGSVSSKSHASSEQTRRVANRCFKNNWSESKRKALEYEEESSIEDVFHVGVEAHDAVDDNRSRLSGLSTVSEWIKSIRVVGSRSDAVHASAEHSSVSAKSLNLNDGDSVQDSHADSTAAATAPI